MGEAFQPSVEQIEEVETSAQIAACFEVFQALRPHLTSAEELVRRIQQQQQAGYRVAGIRDDSDSRARYVSVIGYRPMDCLAWGKTIYIDDLSTLPEARGRGHGGRLLDYVRQQAEATGCDVVHLDSGYTRSDAHRLYLNKGYVLLCHHLLLDLHSDRA